ncbi:MAG: uracil-DNA glycosylase [Erysipelotrichaceae bacterium]|nr:uracil-DNA glycosylase [Erysipelotrichaceae bacterium]
MNNNYISWVNDVHSSFEDFLNDENINLLNQIYETIKDSDYTPDAENVLRFLSNDLSKIKVVIMGQDPYFSVVNGRKVATGRAYEPADVTDFRMKFKQVSLKNIIRLIHKNYHGITDYDKILKFSEIQAEIDCGRFNINYPKAWFDSLERQGVLMLNSSLTTLINQPLAHEKLWHEFTLRLLQYIDRDHVIIYFLWGKSAMAYQGLLKGKVYTSRHPMMCAEKYADDFLKCDCFLDTMDIIDWLGNV